MNTVENSTSKDRDWMMRGHDMAGLMGDFRRYEVIWKFASLRNPHPFGKS